MKGFYAWLMVAIATATLCVSNGMSITGISVYDESLLNTFDWSRGDLKFRDMITFALTGLLAPLAGIAIDRMGVRKVMVFGFAVLGAAYWLYGRLESLTDLYLVHVLLALVLVCTGLNVAVILVSRWFVKKRGTAIGLALVGTSLGGIVFPQWGTYWIGESGWREAYHMSMVFPAVLFLLALLVVRNRPSDVGLPEDQPDASIQGMSAVDISYSDALRSRTFWALAIVAMTTFYTVLGAQAHLFLYMRDLAFTPQQATNAISSLFAASLVGKFLFGMLADYIDQKKVLITNVCVMLLGALLLAAMRADWIWFAVLAFGFGWGGLYTLLQIAAVNNFGLSAAGKILGTITILDALGGGLGIWLTGVMFEAGGGSYQLAFAVFVAMLVVAVIAATQIRSPKSAPVVEALEG